MDKRLTVPKWVLINWPKMPKMPKNYLPKPKRLEFWWKNASLGVRSPWYKLSLTYRLLRWNRSCRVWFVKALEFDTLTVNNQIWQFFGDLKILLLFTATKATRAVNGGGVPGLVSWGRLWVAYKNWRSVLRLWWIRLLQGHWCRYRKCTRPENSKGLERFLG